MPSTGDIVLVDFPGVQGVKRRPAIILSTAAYHAARPDVIIGIITSQISDATASTDHRFVNWRSAGLQRPSAFRAFLVTLPRRGIIASIGRPDPSDWQAILGCVGQSLAR